MNRIVDNIDVHSWGEDGPCYTTRVVGTGFRGRKRPARVETHGIPCPDQHLDPSWYIHAGEWWLFNIGHVYEVHIDVDGEREVLLVDAVDSYAVENYGPGISVSDVQQAPDFGDQDTELDPDSSDDSDPDSSDDSETILSDNDAVVKDSGADGRKKWYERL